ncbi:hypothetical protein DFR28_1166 [Arenicella xantha]|uniref:Uncharacterized protein n=1 Tax=Arenicella xantha TaxID=644221 RepID=A0A395JHJ9_9GAMM|nr:hypothetical protein DFR28_1166 [Arenicella xantha]
MNSINYAFKISQASVAEKRLLGSAGIGLRYRVLALMVSGFQKVAASFFNVVAERSSQQLTSRQSSLRSKLLRGTGLSARPLARRYVY